jgi:hypothetical protein
VDPEKWAYVRGATKCGWSRLSFTCGHISSERPSSSCKLNVKVFGVRT